MHRPHEAATDLINYATVLLSSRARYIARQRMKSNYPIRDGLPYAWRTPYTIELKA